MTDNLISGFKEFRKTAYESDGAVMPALVKDGQDPDYFIISCIDSRANPGTIFNVPPGTFFAHKAMGAIVRPHKKGTALSAALQFALHHMNVSKIIILGHTSCGAVKALASNIDDEEIAEFVNVAQKALDTAKNKTGENADTLLRQAEKEIVLQSAENLKTYPAVAKALEDGDVIIKPWLFDMSSGNILEYDKAADDFISLTGFEGSDIKEGVCCA